MILDRTLLSPRLRVLRNELEAGQSAALDLFWQ